MGMGKELKFISKLHTSTKRNYIERMINNKIYCEVLNEFLFFIITKSYTIIVNTNNYNKIYETISNIKKMKNNDLPSISNKIIFKNMDLYDKYKPNINQI